MFYFLDHPLIEREDLPGYRSSLFITCGTANIRNDFELLS
jgi:hypothetical protein